MSRHKRKLDWMKFFDPRSRQFRASDVLPGKPRSYTWAVGKWLDQGSEGACVGFAWAHELAAKPKPVPRVDDAYARSIYNEARTVDAWPGEAYEGTSVIAGAKVAKRYGYYAEYRWCFSAYEIGLAVGHEGPVVLGVDWFEGMFEPNARGFIEPSGLLAGGHAIVCHGVNWKAGYFKVHNSWGKSWGENGEAKISFADMQFLMDNLGEACVPMGRRLGP